MSKVRVKFEPSQAINDVLVERVRQLSEEGFDAAHDDEHEERELARAAQSYVAHYVGRQWCWDPKQPLKYQEEEVPDTWPWEDGWWKPKNPRRDLVRAAALIIAELERLDRASAS